MKNKITVIGAGLAGCEAAVTIANLGIDVELIDMKPNKRTAAHSSDKFAELVCSNSLKAMRTDSAAGLLKQEMRKLGSICLKAADTCSVGAGGALAVEREAFSDYIDAFVKNHPNITVKSECVSALNLDNITVVATGPLTDSDLALNLKQICDSENLSFYDAAAPIITADSIDFNKAFYAARYSKGDDDYINCPFNKQEYELFHNELIHAESALLHGVDKQPNVYEGCMPIEILAKRGQDSIRFGPLKPVGLKDPRTNSRPWAVVQLRAENREKTLYNIVGFQTNLKFPEQKRVFSLIPGLENADFVRYGVMHRNTFINSPKVLNDDLSLKNAPNIFVAGQLSGVEGYMESAASGIVTGINAARKFLGQDKLVLPEFTMIGALLNYICNSSSKDFQPMGANFGILPEISPKIRDKRERYAALAKRSLDWYSKQEF